MHYRYEKRLPQGKSAPPAGGRWTFSVWAPRLSPALLVGFGLFLLGSAVFPIVSYQFFRSPSFTPLVSPVAEEESMGVLGEAEDLDLTRPSNWFLEAPHFPPKPSRITHYTLSIPKLKIEDATVEIGGKDLKKSLIQYEGTAFPGQFGNTVIFGHSVLPQFFNPENYLTIFSTLPTLEKSNEVFVNFDGVLYRYVIEEIVEVSPSDISVLEQRFDNYYFTLITCVPPGTYLRRLAVRAKLARL